MIRFFCVNTYMDNFDKIFNDEMSKLDEGAFKSLATAGLVGLGALGGTSNADARTNDPTTQVSPSSRVQRVSDETILTKTLPLTKWAEGYRDMAYDDTLGVSSIGYGSNLTSPHIQRYLQDLGYSVSDLTNRRLEIKEEDAEILLKRGMSQALKDAKEFVNNWDQLDPIAKVILVDMSYNLGLTSLNKFKNFKAGLEALDYDTASKEMVDSSWYRQVGRRSKRLVAMMDQLANRSQ